MPHVLANKSLCISCTSMSDMCCCMLPLLSCVVAPQVLTAYMEGERATAAEAVTEGPLAAAQDQVAELQVGGTARPDKAGNCCPES